MTADRSTDDEAHPVAARTRAVREVREVLRLGRLLPLGEAADGAWIAERAAARLLRPAGAAVAGVRIDALRLALAAPDAAGEPAVPAPPSALPPGPLRIAAELAATADAPLPSTATRVREALAAAAVERVGLVVAEVDLRVTELLDAAPSPPRPEEYTPPAARDEDATAVAVRAVPGVVDVRVLRSPHPRFELVVTGDRRVLDVVRAVRGVVGAAAVVVTATT
ncbi:nucleopolyhedrovirus P10 family protein [Streptomyces cavernicola]|uniref:Nucleopolyhedrovirus P10 family protein n=1 Tax=Streptomyces cavernicola TaxID=3043613 RepID=A0ABT6S9T0_9ACTN|nr:nucleopolyhedrovirus P10 family protein [Streptomyces sp. B-S-A6]MDI3404912.1 nucleopolyhedrovirus P10 family protein [Streptomyces sp. B-S-A6]